MKSRVEQLLDIIRNEKVQFDDRDLAWEEWIKEPQAVFEILRDPNLGYRPTQHLRDILAGLRSKNGKRRFSSTKYAR